MSSLALFAFVILPITVPVLAWGAVLGVERFSAVKDGLPRRGAARTAAAIPAPSRDRRTAHDRR